MPGTRWKRLAAGLAVALTTLPAAANRLTLEVWSDASPDHSVACTLALSDGWISVVQVTGAGLPGPQPIRWRASRSEIDALSNGLQAFVGGELRSVDAYAARQPAPPFLSVTWMTRLDDRLATGLYLQHGLAPPRPLKETLAFLGVAQVCGL